jgi:hypothetical protein
MALRIDIPLADIPQNPGASLVLDHPARCSRCGIQPAVHYETHKLRLRIGAKKTGLYRQTYKLSRVYYLRLRVCENCYQSDFAVEPEEFEKDDTALGRLARLHSLMYTLGALIACAGLLLMTSLVPATSALGGIKLYWPYIIGAGGILILGVWLHQRTRQRHILEALEKKGIDPARHPRTEVRTPVLEDDKDPDAIPLQIRLIDEAWAAECATRYNWATYHEGERA